MILQKFSSRKAQAAVEYMLLLAMAVVVVILGFKTFFPKAQEATNRFYEKAAIGIMGKPPPLKSEPEE